MAELHTVWVRRAPETVKSKLKSKHEFDPVKGAELLVQMPVNSSKLSELASVLAERGALDGTSVKCMVYGVVGAEAPKIHSDINVNGDRFTATAYLPFMKNDQTVEEYVEGIADLLADSASNVKGTIQGVFVGMEQVALKKPIKTH